MTPAPIETPRLRLRAPDGPDVPALVEALNDWSVAQWLARPPYPYREADAHAFLALAREAGGAMRVIADRESDALLGVVSVEPDGARAELGYWLRPHAQGRGVMGEAAAALLAAMAASHPGGVTAFATTDPDNRRSEAVLARLGFAAAGERTTSPDRRGSTRLLVWEAPLARFGAGASQAC